MTDSGSDNLRDELNMLLQGEGLSGEPETYDSDIHSWRCAHPDVYGRCSCLDEMVDRIAAVVVRRVAEAKAEGWEDRGRADIEAVETSKPILDDVEYRKGMVDGIDRALFRIRALTVEQEVGQ